MPDIERVLANCELKRLLVHRLLTKLCFKTFQKFALISVSVPVDIRQPLFAENLSNKSCLSGEWLL